MKIEDYEQYWQKGGTYVLPIEIFNELFYEIENWKKESEQLQKKYESEKSKNQIAIEFIENNSLYEEEYDEDYEGNLCVSGASDEYAKKYLLEKLKGENNE